MQCKSSPEVILSYSKFWNRALPVLNATYANITTSAEPCFLPKFFVNHMNHKLKNCSFKNLSGTNLKTLQKWYRLWDCEINRSFASEYGIEHRLTLLSCSQTASSGKSVYNSNLATAVTLVEFVILLFIYQIPNLKHTTGVGKLGHYAFEGKTAWE